MTTINTSKKKKESKEHSDQKDDSKLSDLPPSYMKDPKAKNLMKMLQKGKEKPVEPIRPPSANRRPMPTVAASLNSQTDQKQPQTVSSVLENQLISAQI